MKLPQLPQDKANHFVYGFVIFVLSNIFFSPWIAFGITFIFAIAKEVYDQFDYGGFDWKDILATIVPALILTLKQIYL